MGNRPEDLQELRRTLGQRLAQHRRAAELDQEQLARRTSMHRSSISHIEAGRQCPKHAFWAAADRALSAGGDLIAGYAEVADAELRWRASEDGLGVEHDHDGDDVDRRTLLGLAVGAPLLGRLEQLRRTMDDALPLSPGQTDVDEWERVASDYANSIHLQPPNQLFASLTADLDDLAARITEAAANVKTDLVHSFAQLAALTAIVLVNMKEDAASQRWWRTAARAAAASGDNQLEGLIAGRHAIISIYNDSPENVLAKANRAIHCSAHGSVGSVNGLAARAQILARTGRDGEALDSLRRITEAFPDLPTNLAPTSQWAWPEQRLRFVQSEVHTYAGRVDDAVTAQDAALALYPRASWQGPSQIHAHRAAAIIQDGDVLGGVDYLGGVLDRLNPWQRSNALVHRSATTALVRIPRPQRALPPVREVTALLEATKRA